MRIMMIGKYPPIQGGVSADNYWTAQLLSEMGHEVHVMSNAAEVESMYRMDMDEDDKALLAGFSREGSIHLHMTSADKRHVFIPQVNPTVSKLISIGLEVIDKQRPDFIWAYYMEPYGVVAFLLSKLTGIPYVFRHAGSDLGRLILTKQLQRLHVEVLKNASLIMTKSNHHKRFEGFGVEKEKLAESVSTKFRPDLFFPTPLEKHSPFTLGVYGKTGESKGTSALLEAMALTKREGLSVRLVAHWGGRDLGRYLQQIKDLDIEDIVEVHGFVPHWRIPNFIRSCDAIMFLENRFRITFHHPSVPLESVSCGRPVVTTQEVATKPAYKELLRDSDNAFIITDQVIDQSVLAGIKRVMKRVSESPAMLYPSVFPKTDIPMRISMNALLDIIRYRLKL